MLESMRQNFPVLLAAGAGMALGEWSIVSNNGVYEVPSAECLLIAGMLLERWRGSGVMGAAGSESTETPPGNSVTCSTKWLKDEPGELYETVCGPERHKVLIEPGPGGTHAAPMQVLLPAAASCSATNILDKLRKNHYTVDGFEIQTVATRSTPAQHQQPDILSSVFTSMHMEFIVTSPDADDAVVDDIVRSCSCSVVSNLKRTTRVTKSSLVKRK